MTTLIVNIDSVAALREVRQETTPDPVAAAVLAELAGADGISCCLCEDRRHIQDPDVRLLMKMLRIPLVLEMAATSEMMGIALDVRPKTVTLVPNAHSHRVMEDGIDLIVHNKTISDVVNVLQNNSIRVHLLILPDPEQIKLARQVNANGVEINTRPFCRIAGDEKRKKVFSDIVNVVKLAKKLKLSVTLGRGLDYKTVKAFKGLSEINACRIGHSIISRAMLVGMDRAVRDMRDLVDTI